MIPTSLRPYVLLSYPVHRPKATLALSKSNYLRYTNNTLYDKGPNDLYFAAFCAVAFTILREVVLRGLLKPFANYWLVSARRAKTRKSASVSNGSGKGSPTGKGEARETKKERRQREHTALRFAEQGWSFLYCTVFWTLGMVGPYFNLKAQSLTISQSCFEYQTHSRPNPYGQATPITYFPPSRNSITSLNSAGGSTNST
jgi:acyl-CoA-dependent ceramide synthase